MVVVLALLVIGLVVGYQGVVNTSGTTVRAKKGCIERMVESGRRVDVAKVKVVWVTVSIIAAVELVTTIIFPEPFASLLFVYRLTHIDLFSGLSLRYNICKILMIFYI